MSQLQDIQRAILARFKPPPQPWDERMPDGQQPQTTMALTGREADTRPGRANPNGAPPVVDTTDIGEPPPAAVATNPVTGEPHREVYGSDKVGYRNALDRWKPTNHRSVGQVAKEFAIGAANAVNQTGNPWSAIGGGGAAAVSGTVQPNEINRAYKLARANQDVARQMGEQKEQAQIEGIRSQQDAREEGILAGRERIRQGDERIGQAERRINQTASTSHKRLIASTFNSLKEFDPEDPKNARLVAEFTKEMGYPPPKKTSGSLLQVVEGEDDQGSPTFTVIDKGTQQARTVTGDLPDKTNNQANRETRITTAHIIADSASARSAATIAAENARDAANRGDRQEARRLSRLSKAASIHGDLLAGQEMAKSKDSTERRRGEAIVAKAQKDLGGYSDVYESNGQGGYREKTPKTNLGMSRKRFRTDNPSLKRKSDDEIDQILKDEGYTPLP